MTEAFLTYRGVIRGICGVGQTLGFVTEHRENVATSVYRFDAEKNTLTEQKLPLGGRAIAADEDGNFWIVGNDGKLHHSSASLKSYDPGLESPPNHLAILSQDRLAVIAGEDLVIVSRKTGTISQTLGLAAHGTALAADPTGDWIAVGCQDGRVAVFESEDKSEFQPSESDKLHEGAVTALLFEPEELRFFSAGTDLKLLLTHARGTLEPEDRGRGHGHDDQITAMINAPGERFITGSRDKTCKTWTRSGGARPATLGEGLRVVADLARLTVHDRPHLAVACDDNSIRLFLLDAAGKFGQATHRVHDAYAKAARHLADSDPSRRESALKALAGLDDADGLDQLTRHINSETDPALRKLATELIGASEHKDAPAMLERRIDHRDEAVRLAALAGLRRQLGKAELRPLSLALNHPSVGPVAVKALAELAKTDDQAMTLLTGSIDASLAETRLTAVDALESVYPADSADANLVALESDHGDVRRMALIRLLQRKLLSEARVQSAIRRAGDDAEPDVRHFAFLISLFTSDKLAQAIRERDADYHRLLWELETLGTDKKQDPPKTKKAGALDLGADDYAPVVQAMASRTLDTSLRGAQCLALLGDPRAFGLLLQLSREADPNSRAMVCRALASLQDDRVVQRLVALLDDESPEVRDAAYSGLAKIHSKAPLEAAESGLNSAHADVRGRALKTLVSFVKKSQPKQEGDPGYDLMLRALNDSEKKVRTEAFKAALNQEMCGGGVQSLRFVLKTPQEDIRREVLTEVMGQIREPWAWELLLEFFNDPSSELRLEAFAFALDRTKTKDIAPMQAAMRSPFLDLRKVALETMAELGTPESQAALAEAVEDEDASIRDAALARLIDAQSFAAIEAALSSKHSETRLSAAAALAVQGNAKAISPLVEFLKSEPIEEGTEAYKLWLGQAETALEALGQYGDPETADLVVSFLVHKTRNLRDAAARAMVLVTSAKDLQRLHDLLRHEEDVVRHRAALALAFDGDGIGTPMLLPTGTENVLSRDELIAASLSLGQFEDWVVAFLDSGDSETAATALMALLFLELVSDAEQPSLCVAGLAAREPGIQLVCAEATEAFPSVESMTEYLLKLLERARDGGTGWKLQAATLHEVGAVLALGPGRLKLRLLPILARLGDKEPHGWSLQWGALRSRFSNEIEELVVKLEGAKKRLSQAELQPTVFGTYVGLVREPATPLPIRESAIRRLTKLGQGDALTQAAVHQALLQSLSAQNGAVRKLAFAGLQTLQFDPVRLASECIESGFDDLGAEGLKLLSGGVSSKEGRKILHEVAMTRTDMVAIQAARMLLSEAPDDGVTSAIPLLEATHEGVRRQGTQWLAEHYQNAAAAKALQKATGSKYPAVRMQAAFALAEKKDKTAFDSLFAILDDDAVPNKRQAIRALQTFGDPRTPSALLDRIEAGNADASFFEVVGEFRDPSVAGRLVELMDLEKTRQAALISLHQISGFDQYIQDPDDDEPEDRSWIEEQFSRHDSVLAQLLGKCAELNFWDSTYYRSKQILIQQDARWSLSKEVEPILATLAASADPETRHCAVQALGWRLRKRDGSAEPLVAALNHKDPLTKFFAAEGLARVGKAEGLNVLLAAIDLMDDVYLRIRAVEALGELGDERALDVILKLANEDGHLLQESAAEAIGHLGNSDQREEIFDLLARFVKKGGGLAERAIRGLRWFDTRAGWELVRENAAGDDWATKETATEMLGYNDDPATRDLLISELEEGVYEAFESARRVFGPDSLEPDYAILKSGAMEDDLLEEQMKRVQERGEPSRIFELIPHLYEDVRIALSGNLINATEPAVDEALVSLASEHASVVEVAAHLLGRAKAKPGDLPQQINRWRELWTGERRKAREGDHDAEERASCALACLQRLIWACTRLEVGTSEIVACLTDSTGDESFLPARLAALRALGDLRTADKAMLEAVESTLESPSAPLRELGTLVLSRHSPKQAVAKAETLLSDRPSFERVANRHSKELTNVLQQGGAHPHYQPIVLPHLITNQDAPTLVAVASDETLPETTRLGAIEGLAAIASEPTEEELAKLGKTESMDDELRKAAWRGLRRSKRNRLSSTSQK